MAGFASLIALVVAMFCCENADSLGRTLRVVDRPDRTRKAHARPTPQVGGLALALSLLVVELAWVGTHPDHERLFAVLIIATAGFWFLGYLDDRRDLRPVHRLVAAVLLFGGVMLIEPRMVLTRLDFDLPFLPVIELGYLAFPVTLLCLVGLKNAINMADGKNGIVLGVAICWFYGLAIAVPGYFEPFFHAVIVSLVIVLVYNWNGRLFLGDSGSYVIGALLGLQTIYFYNHPRASLPIAMALVWLVVPTLDCLRLIVVRLRARRSPFKGDLNHLHHHLARKLPWHVALLVYLGIAAGPGFLALFWPQHPLLLLTLAFFLYGAVLFWTTRKPFLDERLTAQRSGSD